MQAGFTISLCMPWDGRCLHKVLHASWVDAYGPIIGAAVAERSVARLSANRLAWSAFLSLMGRGRMLKACIDGAPVGLAMALGEGKDIILYMLYVHPSHARRGIGQALLTAIEAWRPRARAIRLEVLEDNRPAIAWYARRGFEAYGRTEHATGTVGVPAIYMDKPLSGRTARASPASA